jgi:hexokinase
MNELRPTFDAIRACRALFRARIAEGLKESQQEIKALPAFLSPPRRGTSGEALVVDIGGTNCRAALVQCDASGGQKVVAGPVGATLPVRDGGRLESAAAFFDFQAALAAQVANGRSVPVGYCFSYPAEVGPNWDAKLLRWTKGLDIPGVVGREVGALLRAALRARNIQAVRTVVLNDTVASLMAGAAWASSPRVIGLILGTGTNMASFFSGARITKCTGLEASAPMAVNLESGNFTPPGLTAYDDQVDAASNDPGPQRFEKAVSGFWLPQVFAAMYPEFKGFDPREGSGGLVRLRDTSEDPRAREVADTLLTRSADMVAAGLAAVIDLHEGPEPVTVVAEGSLFWKDPQYEPRVSHTLSKLLDGEKPFSIRHMDDANLMGSAIAALATRD